MKSAFKTIAQLRVIFLAFSLFAISSAQASQATGTITAVDLTTRSIEINKQPYTLADVVQVFSPQNSLVTEAGLKVGQNITFWTSTAPGTSKQVVSKIQIQTKFDTSIKN